ncbi:Bacterial Ig-like domain (group 2) [compost metagenome]
MKPLSSLLLILLVCGLFGCAEDDSAVLAGAPNVAAMPPSDAPGRPSAEPGQGGLVVPGAAPTPRFVQIVPFGGIVNAPYEDGTTPAGYPSSLPLSAVVRLSDGTSNTQVIWSSDDPARATVSAQGVVRATIGAQPGSVTITARAVADPTKANAVVIRVQTLGNAAITIF